MKLLLRKSYIINLILGMLVSTWQVSRPAPAIAQQAPEPDILWEARACFYLRNNYLGTDWNTCRTDPNSGRYVGPSINAATSYQGDDVRYGDGEYSINISGTTAKLAANVHNHLDDGFMVGISNAVKIEVRAWVRPGKFQNSENSERKDVNLRASVELPNGGSDVNGSAQEGDFNASTASKNPNELIDFEEKKVTEEVRDCRTSVPDLEKFGYMGELCLVGSRSISPTASVQDGSTHKSIVDATAKVTYSFSVNPIPPEPGCSVTPDEAAINWLNSVAFESKSLDQEIGGFIIPCIGVKDWYYVADKRIGSKTEVDLNPWFWIKAMLYGFVHTHNYSDRLSPQDKYSACVHQVPVYVRGSSGTIWKFTPPTVTPLNDAPGCQRAVDAGFGTEVQIR